MSRRLRIATRRSPLAVWQAEHAADALRRAHPGLIVELVTMVTEGDRRLSGTLAQIGGKGLFVKELEQVLLDGRADLAVHSMKDVPATLPDGLCLTAFMRAEDPRDAFVSARYPDLEAVPTGARVGTASLRRRAQLLRLRPDLEVVEVRGNVGTRLQRMEDDHCQALLLAHAGLTRLGLGHRIRTSLPVETFVPALGQGVIGIECRSDDRQTRRLVKPLHHAATASRMAAERAFGGRLGGSCTVPVAGHAWRRDERLHLIGLVAAPDGRQLVRAELLGRAAGAADLGTRLAEHLLAAGADRILGALGVAV